MTRSADHSMMTKAPEQRGETVQEMVWIDARSVCASKGGETRQWVGLRWVSWWGPDVFSKWDGL